MRIVITLLLLATCTAAQAEEANVIWVSTSNPAQAGAIAFGGLVDSFMAHQEHLRTTPMTHRKVGLRPEPGTTVSVSQGELIVSRLAYRASYLARPLSDFATSQGIPIRAESIRALKMLNNKFCLSSGRCYADADRDGDWDAAGSDGRRAADVPYAVVELREELTEDSRFDLVLVESSGERVKLEKREHFQGKLAFSEPCEGPMEGEIRCGPFVLAAEGKTEEGRVRFSVR